MVTQKGHFPTTCCHLVIKKVIPQRDQEPSIIDVKHEAGTHIPTEIVYEERPVGDSNSNGSLERANQTIQGQIRAIKDFTERQIGATISLDSSILKLLVRHASWTLTTFHVGGDEMTAHQRMRGKPFNQQIAAFGELIFLRLHKTSGPQQQLAVNWFDGCWLGFNTRTEEHIVSLLREDVGKARAEEMAWHDKFEAYEEVTDETCLSRTGRKPISCRWKDIHKGDNEHVEVRSRLIAREIKQKRTVSYFAGTPQLALVRYVISWAATKSKT